MTKVTCSIVLYNHSVNEVVELITSLEKSIAINGIFVIDNSANSIENHFQYFKKVKYYHTPQNPGYGASHNFAFSKAYPSDYHIVINPDILLEPYVIEKLAKFMDLNKDVGLVMPMVKYPNGEIQYLCKRLPTPFDLIFRRFLPKPIRSYFQKALDNYELRTLDYQKQHDIPNLSGCFMFLRSEVFRMLSGFDERFFMYLEDTDLSRRIGEISRTTYWPEVSIIHAYAKDSYKNPRILKYHIYSAIKYFNKWGWFFDQKRSVANKKIQ